MGLLQRGTGNSAPYSAAGEVAWARWKSLDLTDSILWKPECWPRTQAAASPSLTGMLMWALSRGTLWPSRSTST